MENLQGTRFPEFVLIEIVLSYFFLPPDRLVACYRKLELVGAELF